ncbi:hypothetical protein B0H17DRAFT_1206245 [Mycena rosella]|uniref:Uncharacterized protein n=1 Tax=Mycena rosella TaxID=1033263 RepID=A0AAD7D6X3_MYCRO|nr:hypothetical protein B0H17DRAFT_1206245 [Mycena rosella]
MLSIPKTTPLAPVPTLIKFPSFSVPAEQPAVAPAVAPAIALAPIPGPEATALSTLIDRASAITSKELSVANSLGFPLTSLASFIEDEDDELDLDLEEFLNPPPKNKGKAKAAPAPCRLLADGMKKELAEAVEDRGLVADHTEGASCAPAAPIDAQNLSSIITALKKHGENSAAMMSAIHLTIARLEQLEHRAASVTVISSIQATLGSHDHMLKTILSRLSATSDSAPPAPSRNEAAAINAPVANDDAHIHAMVQDIVNQNGKRGREGDADGALPKRQELVNIPPPLSSSPPSPPRLRHQRMPLPPSPRRPPPSPRTLHRLRLPRCHARPWAPLKGSLLTISAHGLKPTMCTARFSSRKGPDDDTAIIAFQAEAVAAWFVATWNANPRIGLAPPSFYSILFEYAVDGPLFFTLLCTRPKWVAPDLTPPLIPYFISITPTFYAPSGYCAPSHH